VVKLWSPDGKRVIEWVAGSGTAYLIDPENDVPIELEGPDDIPAWQRLAR